MRYERQRAYWHRIATTPRFVPDRVTQSKLRKIEDRQGNYDLWRPSAVAGTLATHLGCPVTKVEKMPENAASSLSGAF